MKNIRRRFLFNNYWTNYPATIPEMRKARKEQGYTFTEDLDRMWRRHWVWWILACIPRGVKYYVIIQASTWVDGKVNPNNPGAMTASDMLCNFRVDPSPFQRAGEFFWALKRGEK